MTVHEGPITPVPLAVGEAPAKVILTGEHAVVHGYPALAAPVTSLMARASVTIAPPGYGVQIIAHDMRRASRLDEPEPALIALRTAVRLTLDRSQVTDEPDWMVQIRSDIPIARGLGSGAATATATVRAVARGTRLELNPADVSAIVFACERHLHGRPSGIDNAVIAYGRCLLFERTKPPRFFRPALDMPLLLADTGVASRTALAVQAVAARKTAEPARVNACLREIGELSLRAHEALCTPDAESFAACLNRNQVLLRRLGVSAPSNERLIQAALEAGGLAAKLTGAGMGGQVLALAPASVVDRVHRALREAGAVSVIQMTL